MNSDDGNAKFDSKGKTLKLTLPVVKEEFIRPQPTIGTGAEAKEFDEDEPNETDPSMLKFVSSESIAKAKTGKLRGIIKVRARGIY